MSRMPRLLGPILAIAVVVAACAQPVDGRPGTAPAAPATPVVSAAPAIPAATPTRSPAAAPSASPVAVPTTEAAPSATPEPTAAPVAARELEPYKFNLYRKGDFVAQYTFEWCVGASLQMMLNLAGADETRSRAHQKKLWARARDLSSSPYGGANPIGWTAALNELGVGPYQLVSIPDYDEALRTAARALRETKRPVGLVMWRGRHAWVMSGFTSAGDPRKDEAFRVTGIRVLDPLYPHGSSVWGASPKPNRLLTPARLARQFVSRDQFRLNLGVGPGYVLVLPVS
jgi:hypothetical protein